MTVPKMAKGQAHFNLLTASEGERLAIVAEECSEVIKAICKIERHGFESNFKNGLINRETLEIEMAHVLWAFRMLINAGDVNRDAIDLHLEEKIKGYSYLHHNPEKKK
jgi:NTP pyrophosphatase (non-canonical NTP hydrolase)